MKWGKIFAIALASAIAVGQVGYAAESGQGSTDLPETKSEVEAETLSLYIDYDIMKSLYWDNVNVEYSEIVISDKTICDAELDKIGETPYITFHALKAGQTRISIVDTDCQEEILTFDVTTADLPEDAVQFEDQVLRSRILNGWTDENQDGYISEAELEKAFNLDLKAEYYDEASIQSLKGLENAINLVVLDLGCNTELKNVDVLFELEKLERLSLYDTQVSAEDRWNLSDFKDVECSKGDEFIFPNLCVEDLSIEILENDNVISMYGETDVYIRGLNTGKAKVRVSSDEFSKEIYIIVNGIDYAQEVGAEYTSNVEIRQGWLDEGYEARILTEDGKLWMMCPEPIVVMEDVEVFDGYFALNQQGVLTDLVSGEEIENVKDWQLIYPGDDDDWHSWTLILKNDGSLWNLKRDLYKENSILVKVRDGVKSIDAAGFLDEDGKIYDYENMENPIAENVVSMVETEWAAGSDYDEMISAYYDVDGNLYAKDVSDEYLYPTYVNMGTLKVKDIRRIGCRYGGEWGTAIIILDEQGNVYAYKTDFSITKIDSKVISLNKEREGSIVYIKEDGYYEINGTTGEKMEASVDNPLIMSVENQYEYVTGTSYYMLCTGTDEDCIVVEADMFDIENTSVKILNHVKKIWRDKEEMYALRTDGTVWNISGVPYLILDLNTETYVKGDVNGDGLINIEDLRLILNGVCEKLELTENQKKAADVVGDGMVDIQDLRKELRYVCGKIDSLD